MNKTLLRTVLAAAAAAVLLLPGVWGQTSNAADKTQVSGSNIEILGAPATSVTGTSSRTLTATIFNTTVKTSAPTDLLFLVTLECALWTKVTTVGNDASTSTATVKVWVELDGRPVKVSSDDASDPGKVVFCDRMHQQQTWGFDDQNATIAQFLRTRSANGFNWAALDVGAGTHLVQVKATLDGSTSGKATAQAGIGHRTMIIQPEKFAHGATL